MKRVLLIAMCLSVLLVLPGCRANRKAPANGSNGAQTSSEAAPVAAPTLRGLDTTAAAAALSAAGLKLGTVSESYDESIPAGALIAQTPVPGADTPKGSTVDLVVSKGPAPVAVPDVMNKPEAEASSILKAAGFTVAPTAVENAAAKGLVVAQFPTGGSAPRGSAVRITVSTGAAPVKAGSLIGTWKEKNGTAYTFRVGNRVVTPGGGVVRYRSSGSLLLIFHSGNTAQSTIVWDSPDQFRLTLLKADGTDGPTVTYKRTK